MSSLGRRKARVIKVADDDENANPESSSPSPSASSATPSIAQDSEPTQSAFGAKRRKNPRQSGLRKQVLSRDDSASEDEEAQGPAVVRPGKRPTKGPKKQPNIKPNTLPNSRASTRPNSPPSEDLHTPLDVAQSSIVQKEAPLEPFLVMSDDEDDGLIRNAKEDTRLRPEDEHIGEGFEEFVEDSRLLLGDRAEKERKKREQKQIAALIDAAEGHSSSESSDEDAERRIAYEAAQTRAGMDGLKKPRKNQAEEASKVPAKVTPLPSLAECIRKLQTSLKSLETEISEKDTRVQQLRSEKVEISNREAEVQALLDETGKRYQEATGTGKVDVSAIKNSGSVAELSKERGIESLGTTPSHAPSYDLPML